MQVSHTFVLPHARLRQALAKPMPTPGTGLAQLWPPCTPAMAAGVTEHVWSRNEGLRERGSPWAQPQTVEELVLVAHRGVSGRRVLRGRPGGGSEGVQTRFEG